MPAIFAPHPAVRVAELVVLSLFLVAGSLAFAACMAVPVVAVRLSCGAPRLAAVALWRLKWFFFALGMLAWVSSPEFPGGWHFAARTCLVLALLVLAVDTLHQVCSTGEKLLALLWWLRPLARLGVPVERFVARLWLTLHFMPQGQSQLQQALRARHRLQALRSLLGGQPHGTGQQQAENAVSPGTVIELPQIRMSTLHWCRPLALASLLLLLRFYTV